MTQPRHPGRVAALIRAATAVDVGPRERATLIRLGAPDHQPEHVYAELRRYVQLLQTYHYPDARAALHALTEPAVGGLE